MYIYEYPHAAPLRGLHGVSYKDVPSGHPLLIMNYELFRQAGCLPSQYCILWKNPQRVCPEGTSIDS